MALRQLDGEESNQRWLSEIERPGSIFFQERRPAMRRLIDGQLRPIEQLP
jgi:hypothetical protein